MSERLNDKYLAAEFRQLRETEMKAAPGYRRSSARAAAVMPSRGRRTLIPLAMAATVLMVAFAVFIDTGRDQPSSETAESAPGLAKEVDLVAALEMPTDFLLDTPWFDLAGTTPDFDFQFPQYEVPEDSSDEI